MHQEEKLLKLIDAGDLKAAAELVEKGRNRSPALKLWHAICAGNLPEVKRLIMIGAFNKSKNKINANLVYNDSTTPLYCAYEANQPEIAAYLKTFPDTVFKAVQVAIEKENLSIFKQILDKKTFNELTDKTVFEIWNNASEKNQNDMIVYLLKTVLPYARSSFLHLIKNNNEGALGRLRWRVETGFDVNFCDENNATPLHFAVAYKRKEMAELLLNAGADVLTEGLVVVSTDSEKMTYYGTPKYIAKRIGNQELINLIEQYEEKQLAAEHTVLEEKVKSVINRQKLLLRANAINEIQLEKTATDITKQMQRDFNKVRKLALIGYMCDILGMLPYQKSMSLYEKVVSQTDKETREKMKNIIRENRER